MKKTATILFLIVILVSCKFRQENNIPIVKGDTIVSKIRLKTNNSEIDTFWVSQNDTTVFNREEFIASRPCSRPKLQVYYELKNPKMGAYYFIYDNEKKLAMEGKYTANMYEGATYKAGDFYDSKKYHYKDNGNLEAIHYQEDGRNLKTETFDRKERLKAITFFDKKSGEKSKIEIYKNGQLSETQIYRSYNNYTTVKAHN